MQLVGNTLEWNNRLKRTTSIMPANWVSPLEKLFWAVYNSSQFCHKKKSNVNIQPWWQLFFAVYKVSLKKFL